MGCFSNSDSRFGKKKAAVEDSEGLGLHAEPGPRSQSHSGKVPQVMVCFLAKCLTLVFST